MHILAKNILYDTVSRQTCVLQLTAGAPQEQHAGVLCFFSLGSLHLKMYQIVSDLSATLFTVGTPKMVDFCGEKKMKFNFRVKYPFNAQYVFLLGLLVLV